MGCHNAKHHQFALVGSWKNVDGASFNFKSDSTFTVSSLPPRFFYWMGEYTEKIEGFGIWQFGDDKKRNEIVLIFKKYSGPDGNKGYKMPLYVSESDSTDYLFFWEDEEIGKEYKFLPVR